MTRPPNKCMGDGDVSLLVDVGGGKQFKKFEKRRVLLFVCGTSLPASESDPKRCCAELRKLVIQDYCIETEDCN